MLCFVYKLMLTLHRQKLCIKASCPLPTVKLNQLVCTCSFIDCNSLKEEDTRAAIRLFDRVVTGTSKQPVTCSLWKLHNINHDINILTNAITQLHTSKINEEVKCQSRKSKTKKPPGRTTDLEGYQILMKLLHSARRSISIDLVIHYP